MRPTPTLQITLDVLNKLIQNRTLYILHSCHVYRVCSNTFLIRETKNMRWIERHSLYGEVLPSTPPSRMKTLNPSDWTTKAFCHRFLLEGVTLGLRAVVE
jgi:hypothetical protein